MDIGMEKEHTITGLMQLKIYIMVINIQENGSLGKKMVREQKFILMGKNGQEIIKMGIEMDMGLSLGITGVDMKDNIEMD